MDSRGGPAEDFSQPLTVFLPAQRLLAASPVETLEPCVLCVMTEAAYASTVASDAIVAVMPLHFAFQDAPLFTQWIVPVLAHPLTQIDERSSEPLARGAALDDLLALS